MDRSSKVGEKGWPAAVKWIRNGCLPHNCLGSLGIQYHNDMSGIEFSKTRKEKCAMRDACAFRIMKRPSVECLSVILMRSSHEPGWIMPILPYTNRILVTPLTGLRDLIAQHLPDNTVGLSTYCDYT